MSYLNVVEVESAIAGLATEYPSLCERLTLPNKTVEGRICHAVRIGQKSGSGTRDAILFIGSVHAREWGSADICVSFAADLVEAAATGTGLTYGGKSFTAAEINCITSSLDVYVFPCVNPDGRNYSQLSDPWWRKNLSGVDINRNYDFNWDFATKMNPAAPGASANPADYDYHGTAPTSEPETRNVVWLLDRPEIRWFMDIHCHNGDILYNWGDDQNQTTEPSMNFLNPVWDGKRGIAGDAYGEYIPASDLANARLAVARFAAALTAVRGTVYPVKQGFDLVPTSGASDDYAYSRHFVDGAKTKTFGYTLEYGLFSRPEENTFQPAWPVMQEIIREATAGMLAFCHHFCDDKKPPNTIPWWLWRIMMGKMPRRGDIVPPGPIPMPGLIRALLTLPYALIGLVKKVTSRLFGP